VPIVSNHFVVSKVPHDCTVEAFCKERNLEPSRNNLNMLLESNIVAKSNEDIRDVILMDKVFKI
jgi:hypothetical protein